MAETGSRMRRQPGDCRLRSGFPRLTMQALELPPALSKEFMTVNAALTSGGPTRTVDALLLSWIKHEKQMRRLFSFLVFQHPALKADESALDEFVDVMVERKDLYARHFEAAIDALQVKPVNELMGDAYAELQPELQRIQGYRNKLIHGQLTGHKLGAPELLSDTKFIIRWCAALAEAAQAEFGFDGFRPSSKAARQAKNVVIQKFPFKDQAEFREWLQKVVISVNKKTPKAAKAAKP